MELRSKNYPSRIDRHARANIEKDIQNLAYRLWEQRGRQSGHELEDWLQAESELTKVRVRAATASS
jgi:Protein of unknown function (DUF2934)